MPVAILIDFGYGSWRFLSAHGNVYVGKGRHACKGKIHYAWSYYLFLLSSANRILNLQRLLQ